MQYTKLWLGLIGVIVLSFAVLGYYGGEIYRQAPPVPERVVTTEGIVLFTGQEIKDGQNVWQSLGGQQVGSIWGHGAYVAPDWSADWLHREATWLLDQWASDTHGQAYAQLDEASQASLRVKLQQELRTNTYQPATRNLIVSPVRAEAIAAVGAHYTALFGNDPTLNTLRDAYAIPANTVTDPQRRHVLNAFFFWTAWAYGTNRPGSDITYTNNWPAEALINNAPTGSIIIWSVLSFVILLAGIGALAWYFAVQKHEEADIQHEIPEEDPLLGLTPTPSMSATLKYFWTVMALIVLQVGLGAVTAHYGVEGSGFYGIPLDGWLPYAVTRTWHIQLGIFWIATAWLATGLFVAPAVSGVEPHYQRLGVNVLFVCLLIIVLGSMVGVTANDIVSIKG